MNVYWVAVDRTGWLVEDTMYAEAVCQALASAAVESMGFESRKSVCIEAELLVKGMNLAEYRASRTCCDECCGQK